VPGVVNVELLSELLKNRAIMSAACVRQVFTSPVVEATLETLWLSYAKACWLREFHFYGLFLAVLICFVFIVNQAMATSTPALLGSSVLHQLVYYVITICFGVCGGILAKGEYAQLKPHLDRCWELSDQEDEENNGAQAGTGSRFLLSATLFFDEITFWNGMDIIISCLAVLTSALALLSPPGPLLAALLALESFLSVSNV
jgi:hypothetical protein